MSDDCEYEAAKCRRGCFLLFGRSKPDIHILYSWGKHSLITYSFYYHPKFSEFNPTRKVGPEHTSLFFKSTFNLQFFYSFSPYQPAVYLHRTLGCRTVYHTVSHIHSKETLFFAFLPGYTLLSFFVAEPAGLPVYRKELLMSSLHQDHKVSCDCFCESVINTWSLPTIALVEFRNIYITTFE